MSKNWVTTAIEEDVKEDAKQVEGYTLTEVMQAGIDAIENNTFEPKKGRQIDTEALATEIKDQLVMAQEPGAGVSALELIEKVEELESAVKETTDNVQQVDQKVEDLR